MGSSLLSCISGANEDHLRPYSCSSGSRLKVKAFLIRRRVFPMDLHGFPSAPGRQFLHLPDGPVPRPSLHHNKGYLPLEIPQRLLADTPIFVPFPLFSKKLVYGRGQEAEGPQNRQRNAFAGRGVRIE